MEKCRGLGDPPRRERKTVLGSNERSRGREVVVTMEDPQPEETMEQQDSPKSPGSPGGNICHLGALQCTRCFITFADSKFQESHMKREHPVDIVAQKLQGALFICFTCAHSFLSSKARIVHQRSQGPATRPCPPVAPSTPSPPSLVLTVARPLGRLFL
ncbi:Zinc finger protein 576 [Tupaia chinensis]|uniref:Zinc finger protein 576 n=1 Tax=Tupaia chinensis TaxID=246437 RepID=L9KZR2_TUPCH|nr:Zinc finger protein 576 [Tupaia chinensis]